MKMYEWTLEGLDCANCAAKIERAVAKTPGISEASVNFMQKKLRFSAENDVDLSALEHLILGIEPEVTIEKEAKTGCHCEHCHEEEHEEGSTRARILRIALAAVLFGLSLLLPLPDWAKITLALAAYLIVGADVLWRAIKNILHGAIFDENFLMTLATVGAVAVGQYEEAVGVMLFYQLGELFQDVAVGRSRRSIRDLMNIRPDYANVQVGDQVEKHDPATVQLGDVIVIRPGERVPLDAEVLTGDSMLDTAALTGESVPRSVHPGDAVISGCVNLEGVLTARVTHSFSESTASKILDLVENATSKKAKAENFITKFAHYYTPAVVFSALALALIPPNFVGNFSSWVYRALIFLVISCPCALVISVLTNDNREFEAALVGSDEMSDLAVLKIDARGLQAAEFGDSSKLRVGDSVVAIGDPLGVQLRGTMTNGIISAINRDLTVGDRTMTLIQTNAALNNGNSGGPLINCYGQVIGINTVKMSSYYTASATVEGLGFAIPISVAKPIIDELIENGYVAGRPAIGISGDSLPTYYRAYYRLPDGVYVTSVNDGSDAKAKGIREGDIVTAINGEGISSIDDLNTIKNQYAAGDEVTLTIYRSGAYYEVTVTLVDQATGK